MKKLSIKDIFFARNAVLVVALCFYAGCAPSITSDVMTERVAAVANISDQGALLRIVESGPPQYEEVREAAAEKLTDQATLMKLAEEHKYVEGLGVIAVKKLKDQDALKKFAMEERCNFDFRVAALENVRDQAFLANIFEHDSSKGVRMAALLLLTDKAILNDLLSNQEDHIDQIAKLLLFLTDPVVRQELGTTKLDISQGHISPVAYTEPGPTPGTVWVFHDNRPSYETVTFTVSGEKIPPGRDWEMSPRRARSHTWEADIVHGHVTAVVDVTELAVELLAQLPQTELTKMMRETSNPVVREAITPALAFQTRLVTWAADPDPNVRIKAIRNGLADEALLNKLATLDPDAGVRFIAADRLKILRVPKR